MEIRVILKQNICIKTNYFSINRKRFPTCTNIEIELNYICKTDQTKPIYSSELSLAGSQTEKPWIFMNNFSLLSESEPNPNRKWIIINLF